MIHYRSTNPSVETATLTSTLTHSVTMINDFPLDIHPLEAMGSQVFEHRLTWGSGRGATSSVSLYFLCCKLLF